MEGDSFQAQDEDKAADDAGVVTAEDVGDSGVGVEVVSAGDVGDSGVGVEIVSSGDVGNGGAAAEGMGVEGKGAEAVSVDEGTVCAGGGIGCIEDETAAFEGASAV